MNNRAFSDNAMAVQFVALIGCHCFPRSGRFAVEDDEEAINDPSCGGIF